MATEGQPIETRAPEGGEGRAERLNFREIQQRIDGIDQQDPSTINVATRSLRRSLVDQRADMGKHIKGLGGFGIRDAALHRIADEAANKPPEEAQLFIAEKRGEAEKVERDTTNSVTLRVNRSFQANKGQYEGVFGYSYTRGLDRIETEVLKRSGLDTSDIDPIVSPEDWEWQGVVPEAVAEPIIEPPRPPEPDPALNELRRLREATQQQTQELQKMREQQAQAEDARRKTEEANTRAARAQARRTIATPAAGSPVIDASVEEYLKRIAEGVEVGAGRLSGEEKRLVVDNPLGWMRRRMESIEKVTDVTNPAVQRWLQEITTAMPLIRELNPEIEQEFLARYSLHAFYLHAENSPTVGTILERAGLIDKKKLQTIFRLKTENDQTFAVAEAFRELERRGHEISATTGERLPELHDEIALDVARRAGDPRTNDPNQKEAVLKDWAWSENVAYKLWQVTRASYFNAYNRNPDARSGGSGIFIIRRLYNFREFVKTKTSIEFWKTGPGSQHLDLQMKDFWTRILNSGIVDKDTLFPQNIISENMRKQFLKTDDNKFIPTLENIPFEKLDFINGVKTDSVFITYFDNLNKCDKVRPVFVDAGGFLEMPTIENAMKVWVGAEHLSPERKQEWFAGITKALIEFNRRKSGLGRFATSYALESGRRWKPWSSTEIGDAVRTFAARGFLKPEDSIDQQKKHRATEVETEAKELLKSGLTAGAGAVLSAMLGIGGGGGGKRR